MIKTITLTFLSLFSFIAFAQTPTISWQKTIGGSNSDVGHVVIQLSNGDYVIAASSKSGISGEKTENSFGLTDMWIFQMTSSGQMVWQKTYGGSQEDVPKDIISTSDGGFLVVGESNSPISGNKTTTSYGGFDVWVLKIDASGTEVWQKSFGGDSDDWAPKITSLSDGSYVISASSASGNTGNKTLPSNGGSDYWIINISENGNELDQHAFGGSGMDMLISVSEYSNNRLLLSGRSNSNISGDKMENSYGSYDYWVLISDLNGNIIRSQTFGGDQLEYSSGALALESTEIILFGSSYSGVSGNKISSNFGDLDYWFLKLDSNLNIVWDTIYGGTNGEEWVEAQGILYEPSNLILFAGESTSDVSGNKSLPRFDQTLPSISPDIWIIGLNSEGEKVLEFVGGGNDFEKIPNLIQTSNNTILVTCGSSSNTSGNKTESSRGDLDVWVFELDLNLSIEKIQVDNSSLHAYPVPAKTVLNFAIPKKGVKSQISLIDISGRVVYSGANAIGEDQTIDVSNFPPGVYVLSVMSDEFHYTRKVVIE